MYMKGIEMKLEDILFGHDIFTTLLGYVWPLMANLAIFLPGVDGSPGRGDLCHRWHRGSLRGGAS